MTTSAKMGMAIDQGRHWLVNITAPIVNPVLNTAKKAIDTVYPVNPVTARRNIRIIPEFIVNNLGAWHFTVACRDHAVDADEDWSKIVKEVGEQLQKHCDRPDLAWEFKVVYDRSVNACCYPGGKTFITTALLKKLMPKGKDHEQKLKIFKENIAGVLGHEMGHACASHSAGQMQIGILMNSVGVVGELAVGSFVAAKNQPEPVVEAEEDKKLSYAERSKKAKEARKAAEAAREQGALAGKIFRVVWNILSRLWAARHSRHCETEADAVGMKYALKAGYGTEGMIRAQHVIADSGKVDKGWSSWFSSHPVTEERIISCRKIKQVLDSDGAEGLLMSSLETQLKTITNV